MPDEPTGRGRGSGHAARNAHKARQLCRQVFRALGYELPGLGDALLRDLVVHSVVPMPDASRLLVLVYLSPPEPGVTVLDVLGRLHQAAPTLRYAVAQAISRKRAPELAFQVIADPGAGAGADPDDHPRDRDGGASGAGEARP